MNLKSLYSSVAVSTILLFGLAYLGGYLAKKEIPTIVWVLIPVYSILTIVLYRMICSSVVKNPTRFVTSVYASVLIKLMLSVIIVGVYFFLQYPGRKAFTISMMGIYAVNTVVLIRALLPIVRGESPRAQH